MAQKHGRQRIRRHNVNCCRKEWISKNECAVRNRVKKKEQTIIFFKSTSCMGQGEEEKRKTNERTYSTQNERTKTNQIVWEHHERVTKRISRRTRTKKKQKRKDKKWAIANPTHKAKDKRVETSMQLFQIYGIISFMCASVNALRLLHFRRSYKEPTNVLI